MTDLVYPEKITEALREVLGLMIFTTGPIAQAFRETGHDIPRRAEDEHAFVLHWLIRLALEHGTGWRPLAGAEIRCLLAEIKAKGGAA